MPYLDRIPSPPLNRYIERLYYMEGWMSARSEKIPPIPVLNLQINLGDAITMFERDRTTSPIHLTESWLGGLYGVHHCVEWMPYMRLYGVRFKPNGAQPFWRFPLSDVYNQHVPLDAVWGRCASELREQLHNAPTVAAGLALFEQFLRARFLETPRTTHEQSIVEYAISVMRQKHGTLSIRGLSDHIGISQNQLGSLFKRVVGTSTKELARLYRFQNVLRSLHPMPSMELTQMALEWGYHDLSHLNKDFLAFTGNSPTDYLASRRRSHTEASLPDHLSLCTVPSD